MRAALGAVAERWARPSEEMWRESGIHNRLGCEAVWSAMLTQAVREVEEGTIVLEPGWFARDVEKAARRMEMWKEPASGDSAAATKKGPIGE
jgi:hypothetical protein